jgi:cytosine/adenosine deaminase-related metal-dependent hydrolase/ubiquinone/menaquinone biosynthesis C-methylase UbiE
MSATAERSCATHNARAFAAWAEVYDKQENPVLALEERYLTCLLPERTGRHLLDVGCGTGRWLGRLVQEGRAASLRGVDGSMEMLEAASAKTLPGVLLTHGELPSLPVVSASADLVLVSFVLSYVDDLRRCASELARVTREDGDVFLSDMHPETSAALGWERSFGVGDRKHVLQESHWSLGEIKDAFAACGFVLVACLEPSFGEMEHELFRVRGKDELWHEAAGMPAIYLLHFRRQQNLPLRVESEGSPDALHFYGAHCALGVNELVRASVVIDDGIIASIVHDSAAPCVDQANNAREIDLEEYILFPGLVNAHDHLEFALFPRLGSPPYQNATQWALDIQTSEAETIALHRQVPKDVRLWWGGIRNLLCGVTTVCHHNPLELVLQSANYPVRVVKQYGWEHSPAFAKDISLALRETGSDEPFLIHACEGVDQTAAEEFEVLDRLNALGERTVLVHGLALDQKSAKLLNERNAALIVCPSSNCFLFGRTHTREQLRSIQRLAIGSDSPLTATGDLLDEVRFTKSACNLQAEEIYGLVTDQPARILHLRNGEGTLRPDAVADLIAVRRQAASPAEILSGLSWRDVELVVVGGRVHLASSEIFQRLPTDMKRRLIPFEIGDELRWLPCSAREFMEAAEAVLGKGSVRVGGLQVRQWRYSDAAHDASFIVAGNKSEAMNVD